MLARRIASWAARTMVCAVGAGLLMASPTQAEPLWPSGYGPAVPAGPDIPGAAPLIKNWRDIQVPKEMSDALPKDKSPCKAPGVRACIDKSSQLGWLMDGKGNTVFGPTPIATGRPGYETPVAITKVFLKKPYHWSTMHFADMYWAVFFNGDMAFHVGDVTELSHGCIRMTEEGAKAFYDHLRLGDLVQVQV